MAKNLISSGSAAATVIISTYNSPRLLSLCLAGYYRQTFRNFEVHIADDGSDEKTFGVIDKYRRLCDFPILHSWQENRGMRKSKIVNTVLAQVKTPYVIFTDGDCVPHKNFVQGHLDFSQKGKYLAGRRVDLGRSLTEWLTEERIQDGFFELWHPRYLWSCLFEDTQFGHRALEVQTPWMRKLFGMNRVDDLKGCNFSVSTEALLKINGFNEDFEGYYGEDTDVELRLKHLGYSIGSLKGVALQFHLWHPRQNIVNTNKGRLDKLENSKAVRCQRGIVVDPTAYY